MIDYDQPWGWATGQAKSKNSNMIAPLGAAGPEGVPAPVMADPSMQDKMLQQVGGALANKAVDGAAKGFGEYMNAAPLGQVVDATGGAETAVEAAGNALPAASVLGPFGAAVSGAMKGEYDQAAGAALGTAVGNVFAGPLAGMVLGKLGGAVGNAVGSMFGLADGTTKVPDEKKPGILDTIWNKLVEKGSEAVKASTGNSGALGQAKQAISSRKERLDDEERKAMGYAWGTTGAGGKGFGGSQGGTVLNRPWGSTAPTGYYGPGSFQGGTAPTVWKPKASAFTTTQQQSQAVPTAQGVWQPQYESYGGGDSAGEGGGSGVGSGAGNGIGGVGASSGSGIGNGAEGDAAGPGGDAGAGGGGGGAGGK